VNQWAFESTTEDRRPATFLYPIVSTARNFTFPLIMWL